MDGIRSLSRVSGREFMRGKSGRTKSFLGMFDSAQSFSMTAATIAALTRSLPQCTAEAASPAAKRGNGLGGVAFIVLVLAVLLMMGRI